MTNIVQKRFEDALKKLTADLEMKSSQRDELKERQQLKKAGILMDTVEDTDPDNVGGRMSMMMMPTCSVMNLM
jgi:transcription initiation factor TFIID subunit 7